MPSIELTRWIAFEREYGPILVHDRIDYGLAHVAYRVASAFSRREPRFRDLLPPWHRRKATPRITNPDAVRSVFEGLMQMQPEGRE